MSSVRNLCEKYFYAMSEDSFCTLAAGLFIALIGYIFCGIFVVDFDYDEFESVHTAWKMLQGQQIFKDFFQHHHQLFYYLLIPIVHISGEVIRTLYIARIVTFLIYLGILFVIFCIALRCFSRTTAWATLFFVTGLPFVPCAFQLRPDGSMLLCALIGVLFFFRFLEQKKIKYLAISGIFLGISFLVLHKVVSLLAALGLLCLYLWSHKRLSFFDMVKYAFFGAIPCALFALYITYQHLWDIYIICNWLFNMYQPYRTSILGHVLDLYQQSRIVMLFFTLGLLFYLKTPYARYIGYFAVTLLLFVTLIIRVPLIQYYLLPFPFIAMVAAQAAMQLCKNNYAQLFVIIFMHLLHAQLGGGHHLLTHGFETSESVKRAQYVLDATDRKDYVYGGTAAYNLFRNDIHYFWFGAGLDLDTHDFAQLYQNLFGVTYDIHAAIAEKEPKVIATKFLEVTDPAIAHYYTVSEHMEHLMIRKS